MITDNYYLLDGLPDDSQLMLLLLNFHLVRVVLSVSGKHYWANWHVLDTNQYQHVWILRSLCSLIMDLIECLLTSGPKEGSPGKFCGRPA